MDWALDGFSGYLAIDELYDGPFCVLSAVDGPHQRRLLYEVLDHDPAHGDIGRFLGRLRSALTSHGLAVRGITTDGSALYPPPLAEVFPGVPHQVCEFHVLKELTKATLRALAGIRKRLAAQAPKLPAGGSRARRRPGAGTAGLNGSSSAWRTCSSSATCSSATTSARRSGPRWGGWCVASLA